MGFVEFLFETKKGKTIMGLLYGMGAAVVIVGALFKIMHWPGAGPMLVVGLSTEALIFAVSSFEPAHMGLDWTLVYPELAGMHDEDGHAIENKGSAVEQLDTMLEDAKIDSALIESLGTGLRSLSTNANKLSEISDASVATNEYATSLKTASGKVSALADDYAKASESLAVLNEAANSGANTGEEMKKMAATLGALNDSYASQLSGSQQQAETMQTMYAELSTNLSALNNIYGNMLTAMKS